MNRVLAGCLAICTAVAANSVERFVAAAAAETAPGAYGDGARGCLVYHTSVEAGRNATLFLTTAFGVDLSTAPPFAVVSSGGAVRLRYLYPNNVAPVPGAAHNLFYEMQGVEMTRGAAVTSYVQCEHLSPASDLPHFSLGGLKVADGNRLVIGCAGPGVCNVTMTSFAGSVGLCGAVVEGIFDTLPPHWVLCLRAVAELGLGALLWRGTLRDCGRRARCRSARQEQRVHAYVVSDVEPAAVTAAKAPTPEVGHAIMWARLAILGASALRYLAIAASHWSGFVAWNLYAALVARSALLSSTLFLGVLRLAHLVMSPSLDKDPSSSLLMHQYDRVDAAMLALPAAMFAPVVVTHLIPSLVVFCWVFLLGFLATAVLGGLGWLLRRYGRQGCRGRRPIGVKTVVVPGGRSAHEKLAEEDRILAVVLCGYWCICTHFGCQLVAVLYNGLSYRDVIRLDYALRSGWGFFSHEPEAFTNSAGVFEQDSLVYRLLMLA